MGHGTWARLPACSGLEDAEDCRNLSHCLRHPEWFCQQRWLQVGEGLPQVTPCLRGCFLGHSPQQLSGGILLPAPAQVESVLGLGHKGGLFISLPISFWPRGRCAGARTVSGDRATSGPRTGSSAERTSFSAQVRAEIPLSLALGAPIPPSLEEWKGRHEHPAGPSSGGHPGRAEPRREEPRPVLCDFAASLLPVVGPGDSGMDGTLVL